MKARLLVLAAIAVTLVTGCRRDVPDSMAPGVAPNKPSAKAATDRNACHLLTHAEVSALVQRKVTMADQTEASDTFSSCDWEDESGTFAFGLTVYWSGGKEQWETWRLAQGLGNAALKRAEGVESGAVVKQGLVPGIGDAAFFSPVLPSLVLKGDTLFEIKFSLAAKADAKFAGLAAKLLAKLN
jgi:hypothetical protein